MEWARTRRLESEDDKKNTKSKSRERPYNEWNYSKFRLSQLLDYDKIIFIDADLLILRNIDFLFGMPEISATKNNGTLFNSGVMLIEPSNCTFQLLMDHINEIESYNGGDQGYLNEIFTCSSPLTSRSVTEELHDPVISRPDELGGTGAKFHVALTATDAPCSKWQCRIMYYWYKKMKDMPGSDMGGFTRVFA
ncbi:plant glycogenin-like starch initiation protein 1 [Perilla frutescens var. hirtella]|nr:plant glycogenin-like starch initiation protein 1 [Perilla frutescens var. hirtella]